MGGYIFAVYLKYDFILFLLRFLFPYHFILILFLEVIVMIYSVNNVIYVRAFFYAADAAFVVAPLRDGNRRASPGNTFIDNVVPFRASHLREEVAEPACRVNAPVAVKVRRDGRSALGANVKAALQALVATVVRDPQVKRYSALRSNRAG